MEKIRGEKIILNGMPSRWSDYAPDPSSGIYYEVIRRMNNRLLFPVDHLNRLALSCASSGSECPEKDVLFENLHRLTEIVPFPDGNIKLVIFRKMEKLNIACFFIPHFYPSPGDYHSGVITKTYAFERPNPNVKRWNEDFRHNVGQFIRDEGIYEAVLVNQQGELTEGSRSNLFLIDGNQRLFTAPEDMILPGITRNYVLRICQQSHIQVIEKPVPLSEAGNMVSCFITGTSPKVLPVRQLDNIYFTPESEVIKEIMSGYEELIR